MSTQYLSSVLYAALTAWAASTAYSIGDIRRQLATPAVGSERVFRCTTAGTSGGTEPTWTLTAGGTTNDGTAVWTEVTGNATYNWGAPHARAANAYASGWLAADEVCYMAHDHAETQATTVTFSPPSGSRTLCVNSAGSVPPVSADLRTTATIAATGASNINISNTAYREGITFLAGSGSSAGSINVGSAAGTLDKSKNCKFKLNNTNASSVIQFGGVTNTFAESELVNTTVEFGSTSQSIQVKHGVLKWRDTPNAIVGATIPTNLFTGAGNGATGLMHAIGVDLDAAGSGKNLVGTALQLDVLYIFEDCRLNASVTVAPAGVVSNVHVIRSGAAATDIKRIDKHRNEGVETTEATIVRTGGASMHGVPYSKKVVTGSGASFQRPFAGVPLTIDNAVIGTNRVVTLYGIWGGGAVPDNDDLWFEVRYPGSAASPQASFKSCAKADILAASAAHSTDASVWGGSTTPFKMQITLSSPQPQLPGLITLQPFYALPSTTFYYDPKPVLS